MRNRRPAIGVRNAKANVVSTDLLGSSPAVLLLGAGVDQLALPQQHDENTYQSQGATEQHPPGEFVMEQRDAKEDTKYWRQQCQRRQAGDWIATQQAIPTGVRNHAGQACSERQCG